VGKEIQPFDSCAHILSQKKLQEVQAARRNLGTDFFRKSYFT